MYCEVCDREGRAQQKGRSMLQIVKVKVEELTLEAFAPFGQVISTFAEAKPEVRVGSLVEGAYEVTSRIPDPLPEELSLTEGRLRAHFACHDDAGQSFYPSRHCPSVFFVAPVQKTIEPEDLRAFYSDGSLGICMAPEIWHTMPICLKGDEVFLTARGDQDYQAHSLDVHFDEDRGLALEPDMDNFPGWSG